MASKRKTDKTIRDKISSTWGLVLTAFTIFGVGFGAGCHFWKMNHYDEITKLNNQILDNREKAEKEILGLHNQIYALQEELIVEKSLHHEKNSALRALIKHINIIIVLLILSLATSIWLLYENHTYDRLLNEKDVLIHRLQVRDSISSELLNIQETDTSFYYVVSRDDEGKTLSYSELDSLMWYYKIETDIKDKIIVHSKNIYHFNYSVKRDDDGHILLKFWNKK